MTLSSEPTPSFPAAVLPVVVVGAGPAGLAAAEALAAAGQAVAVFDSMPSAGRKFLLAGRGGLNLSHSEPVELFASRFAARTSVVEPWLQRFSPQAVRDWAEGLGISTFIGTSGRVFPSDLKAAPLLRAWLHRLRGAGVQFNMRHRWLDWADAGAEEGVHALRFSTPDGERTVRARVVVLALGGGSWARLGSDGAWVASLQAHGVAVAPLLPSNCGFDAAGRAGAEAPGWSAYFAERFAGQPFKSVAIQFDDGPHGRFERRGEFVATRTGVEGSLVYAASALLRNAIAREGRATFHLDLLPDFSPDRVLAAVRHPRGSRSLSSHLKSRLGLEGIKAGLLHELLDKSAMANPDALADAIKALPITLVAPRPMDEAISTAGGVMFEGLDQGLMLHRYAGLFCAGEMLDWEAPTGGYLLTASMASGRVAGEAAAAFLGR